MIKRFWFLEGKLSDGNTLLIKIDTFPFVVGRGKKCNLSLSSKAVSRRHSEIFLHGAYPALRDLHSTNGTFVNMKKISDAVELHDEDSISFADQQFRLFSTDDRTGANGNKTDIMKDPQKKHKNFSEFYGLSRREEEILYHVLQGKSTKDIGKVLFISEGTAKNHILNIFEKTNVHSRFKLLTLYNKFPPAKKKL
jgi:DNA-binding CsgD family transcriptional regulator